MQPYAAEWATTTHAVVVCGHAIYVGGPNLQPAVAAEQDKYWVLQSFQQGEGPYYMEHIRAGVEIAATDRNALLIFSGGQTRSTNILSEAQSYHHLATLFQFWGHATVASRTTTEEYARDSYDNVLFSLARFHECVGSFPSKLTLISWAFKRKRFEHHCMTVHWPLNRLSFVGIGTPDDLQSALTSEAKTLKEFNVDNTGYGSNGGPLGKKKMARNPFRRHHGYCQSVPSMTPLLIWTGTGPCPDDSLPWTSTSTTPATTTTATDTIDSTNNDTTTITTG